GRQKSKVLSIWSRQGLSGSRLKIGINAEFRQSRPSSELILTEAPATFIGAFALFRAQAELALAYLGGGFEMRTNRTLATISALGMVAPLLAMTPDPAAAR